MADTTRPSPPRDTPPNWESLARYLAGESPADEARAVEAWVTANPGDDRMLGALATAVDRAMRAPRGAEGAQEVDVEAALQRVKARRDEERAPSLSPAAPAPVFYSVPSPAAPSPIIPSSASPASSLAVAPFRERAEDKRRRRAARVARLRLVAGGLAAAAGIAVIVARFVGRGVPAVATPGERAPGEFAGGVRLAGPGSVVATPVGVRDSVRLLDGTIVVLAPASRLTLAADYGEGERNVSLDGAALFAVVHDSAHPFAVHAGNAVVRDVGTAFTVRADELQGPRGGVTVAVAVTEGKVALRNGAELAGPTVTLSAGDRGVLRANGQVVAARAAVTETDTAWTRGRLVYRDAELDVVRADLRRWYGVELSVTDPELDARHLTATFAGESPRQVLAVIALALGARVDWRGDTAVVTAPGERDAGGR